MHAYPKADSVFLGIYFKARKIVRMLRMMIKTPTMIMHGQVDTRVPIAQAQEFYQALVERKVPVDFVVYPRENHGFTEPRHNLDRVRRYVRFFAKYLKR